MGIYLRDREEFLKNYGELKKSVIAVYIVRMLK